MIVAFSGPTDPRVPNVKERILVAIEQAKLQLVPVREVRTGAAYGIDSYAYKAAKLAFPSAIHSVWVPYKEGQPLWHNAGLVRAARDAGDEIHCVEGGYMKRNEALVRGANVLIAFPATDHEVLRSGTWSTVRRARKRGCFVWHRPLCQPLDEQRTGVLSW